MLDTGITTFGDILDGQEPHSLKDVFAFTCPSYVMSKILQKHGRVEGSQVLADTGLWRLAIKKENDRFIYDEVVKIMWPEIEFLMTYSKTTDGSSTSTPPELDQCGMAATDLGINSESTRSSYVPSSMLAYGMTTPSDCNFIERARAISCSYIEGDMQAVLDGQDNDPGPDNQDSHHGLQGHVIELLQETKTHEAFMFADFLSLHSLPWESNIDSAQTGQPPDVMSTAHPPGTSPRTCQSIASIETIDPKQLYNAYTQPEYDHIESLTVSIANPEPRFRTSHSHQNQWILLHFHPF